MKCDPCRYLQRNPYLYPDAEDETSTAEQVPGSFSIPAEAHDSAAEATAFIIIVFFYFVFKNR